MRSFGLEAHGPLRGELLRLAEAPLSLAVIERGGGTVGSGTLPLTVTPRQIDAYCFTLPAATRTVQWEGVVVFKVGGKMFCLIAPPGHSVGRISFKCAPEHYDALSRAEGFRPAPYLARAKWVALDDPKTLTAAETKAYLRRAHAVIAAALPKRKQAELGLGGSSTVM